MSKHPALIELDAAQREFAEAAAEFRAAEEALEAAERKFNLAIEREQNASEAVAELPLSVTLFAEAEPNKRAGGSNAASK